VDVERASDLYAEGWTLRQIGAELGVPWTARSRPIPRNSPLARESGSRILVVT